MDLPVLPLRSGSPQSNQNKIQSLSGKNLTLTKQFALLNDNVILTQYKHNVRLVYQHAGLETASHLPLPAVISTRQQA